MVRFPLGGYGFAVLIDDGRPGRGVDGHGFVDGGFVNKLNSNGDRGYASFLYGLSIGIF